MTIEERAKTVSDEVGTATTGAELRVLIAQALRDQVEDCAKIADDFHASCGPHCSVKHHSALIAEAIRQARESPPLEARIAKACDKLDELEERQ